MATPCAYEQLNAAIGFKASPYPGLWINLYGGYQDLKDDFFEVQEEMDYNNNPSLPDGDGQGENTPSPVTAHQYLNLEFSNTNNFYAGMKISYEYKDLIALSAAGTYRNWDAKEKYSLYMKPACEINFSADFRPITTASASRWVHEYNIGMTSLLCHLCHLFSCISLKKMNICHMICSRIGNCILYSERI